MKARKIKRDRTFVIRLDRGDEIVSRLAEFCQKNGITGGMIYGIGALSYAEFYAVINSNDFETNEKKVTGAMEIISALGNVSTDADGKPVIHMHACVELNAKKQEAGHLLKGIISYTGEFFIFETDKIQKHKSGSLNIFDL